jgi:hypothetical protein
MPVLIPPTKTLGPKGNEGSHGEGAAGQVWWRAQNPLGWQVRGDGQPVPDEHLTVHSFKTGS